jgi:hypothetical protein
VLHAVGQLEPRQFVRHFDFELNGVGHKLQTSSRTLAVENHLSKFNVDRATHCKCQTGSCGD